MSILKSVQIDLHQKSMLNWNFHLRKKCES
nr:MAG TPA: hypothetical protein [Caudoviricetes sp.]